ncbi:MAG TPA: translesion DNA synthesis-associated protein ImuA [Burkholderiaceae bacterium]|nr:translesion DNA synthesis-associated protein ImuA [Burkholderiaceae bacterium]
MAADPSLPAAVWRADQLGHRGTAALDSGFPLLNAELPGSGWPLGMLTELIIREPGSGEMRLLVPLLRALTRERKVVILLAPPLVPYAPALAGFGIDLDCLVIVQARHAADRLWAVEQSLKSASFGALLAWLPQEGTRPEHLRRLQLAAQTARGPVFLFRTLPAQFESSPAPLRLLLLPRPDEHLSVQVLKRRGPVLARPLLLALHKPVTSIRLRSSPPRRPASDKALVPNHAPTEHAPTDPVPTSHASAAHAPAVEPQPAPRRPASTLLN